MEKVTLKNYTSLKDSIEEFNRINNVVKFTDVQTKDWLVSVLKPLSVPIEVVACQIQLLSPMIKVVNDMEDDNERWKMFKPYIGKKLLTAIDIRRQIEESVLDGVEFELDNDTYTSSNPINRWNIDTSMGFITMLYDIGFINTKRYKYFYVDDTSMVREFCRHKTGNLSNIESITRSDIVHKVFEDLFNDRKFYINSTTTYSDTIYSEYKYLKIEDIVNIANEFVRLGNEQKEREKELLDN